MDHQIKVFLVLFITGWGSLPLANAQTYFGFRAGAISTEADIYRVSEDAILGVEGGGVLKYFADENAGLQVELNFTKKGFGKDTVTFLEKSLLSGYGYGIDSLTRRLEIWYLEMPIMAKFYINIKDLRMNIDFGSSIAYGLYGHQRRANAFGNTSTVDHPFVKGIDNRFLYAVATGLGISKAYPFGTVELSTRATIGINHLFKRQTIFDENSRPLTVGVFATYIINERKK